MAANFEYSMIPSGAQEHCFPELLKVADNQIGNPALCFPKYSRLDGSVKNAAKQEIAGWVSKKMSDKNGSFSTYPSMTLKFARAKNCSGISLSFNRTSGDFANFRILWMDASGTVLKSESCSPADPEVSVFTELSGIASVRLTFQSTNRPYRPVFLERVEFLNLRAYESFKLVYDELAPGAAENAVFSSTAKRPEITELSWLTSGESQNLALCLPKYSRLDGTFRNYSSSKMAGWVSQAISAEHLPAHRLFTVNWEVATIPVQVFISASGRAREITAAVSPSTGITVIRFWPVRTSRQTAMISSVKSQWKIIPVFRLPAKRRTSPTGRQ